MRRVFSTFFGLALVFALASPLSAQEQPKHRGFWISFGVGGGWNLSRNVGAEGRSAGGGAGFIRMGGTPSERLLLGGEIIGWGRSEDGASLGRGNATFTAMFYPSVEAGVYLKGGIGGSSIASTVSSGNTTTTVHDGGFGATIGVGWDIRLARNFYLTPGVDFLYQRVSDFDNTMLLITVGATWH
jgi:hypothetical protein